jgi:hypothetical protein
MEMARQTHRIGFVVADKMTVEGIAIPILTPVSQHVSTSRER